MVLVLGLFGFVYFALAGRLPSSPYGVSSLGLNSTRTLYVINDGSFDDQVAVSSLQGSLARDSSVGVWRAGGNYYDRWLGCRFLSAPRHRSDSCVDQTDVCCLLSGCMG